MGSAVLALIACTGAGAATKAAALKTSAKEAKAADIPVLQISVTVPPSVHPLWSDDVAEAFADRAIDALRRDGFKGRIAYLQSLDDPKPGIPLLTINLMDWRRNHVDSIDCTCTASIKAGGTEKDLGIFTGTSMMMGFRHDRFALADEFDDAAGEALDDLYGRMESTKLVQVRGES